MVSKSIAYSLAFGIDNSVFFRTGRIFEGKFVFWVHQNPCYFPAGKSHGQEACSRSLPAIDR